MPSPGVVHISRFVTSTNNAFKNYIDYLDRKEAIRNDAFNRYSLYNDYMGNPVKTTGLFNKEKDILSDIEKENIKELFVMAQQKGSIMWQDVFSFDNKWLEKQGLYHSGSKSLDEEKLKHAVRESMNELFEKDNLKGSGIWSAAIHYNTDNIHIHVATCEPNPTKRRGKRKPKIMYNMKSKFVNSLLDAEKDYKKINEIIRENLIKSKQEFSSTSDYEMKKMFKKVITNLPVDKRQWHYNYNTMKNSRVYLDKMTAYYINTYKKKEYNELLKKLDKQEEVLKTIYGVGQFEKYKDYKTNKIKDLQTRMGNTILKEVKVFIKEKENRADYCKSSTRNKTMNIHISRRDIDRLSKALSDESSHWKNMNYYEKLEKEIEYNNQR
ncbi:MobP2 family relaxase [Clostridioides difficile]